MHYVETLPYNVAEVIIISDGCSYQNRNKVLASSLQDPTLHKNITLEQLILAKGHTIMECNCVHSVLETLFKSIQIYAPSDHVTLLRQVRRN